MGLGLCGEASLAVCRKAENIVHKIERNHEFGFSWGTKSNNSAKRNDEFISSKNGVVSEEIRQEKFQRCRFLTETAGFFYPA
jgi:hypothetical protein